MRSMPPLSMILAILACTSALAQEADGPRRIYPTQDGFLEVEPRSGAIRECKRSPDGYRCTVVAQGDPVLKEDGRPQAQAPAAPPSLRGREPPLLPNDEELDRALDVLEKFLRRFMGIIRNGRPERT